MSRALVFLLCGLVFGAGLALSGMTDPAKVVGFLDFFGRWDPRLTATMGGAVAVAALGQGLIRRWGRPLLCAESPAPPPTRIDLRLVAGSVIFGAGWGLAGLCPAPALAVSAQNPLALLFVAGFVAGLLGISRLGGKG
ncbi:putative membrane protein (Sulphur transport domain 82-123) [Magnetospirillum sp. XM-1]|uniref:DUF6691 family protein n=1 Tax=Magnetospirillum sp. XM-1 TaxID=1663591 RepID=UPI00073E01E3|nr:DUF6691 family protein [Magnetospirillum sp. XM-1]CUW41291.1 putative membrane protein (Sulphur transport domain 82-123) [Magnetospirillum sp. XM-1]